VIKTLAYVTGFIILIALSVITGGLLFVPAFPFMVLILQKLGVVPK